MTCGKRRLWAILDACGHSSTGSDSPGLASSWSDFVENPSPRDAPRHLWVAHKLLSWGRNPGVLDCPVCLEDCPPCLVMTRLMTLQVAFRWPRGIPSPVPPILRLQCSALGTSTSTKDAASHSLITLVRPTQIKSFIWLANERIPPRRTSRMTELICPDSRLLPADAAD